MLDIWYYLCSLGILLQLVQLWVTTLQEVL